MSEFTSYDAPETEDRKRTRLLDEVRARVHWGEPADDVKIWALAQDVEIAEVEIDETLATAQRDRAAFIRQRGRRDLLLGVPVLFPGAALSTWALWELYWGVLQGIAVGHVSGATAYVVLVVGLVPTLVGGFFTFRGLDRLIFGPRAENPHA